MVTPVRHDLSDPAIPEGMVRISAGAEHRFIWPVHLGGWQSLGWQLQEAAADLPIAPLAPEPKEVAQPLLAVEPEAVLEQEAEPEPMPLSGSCGESFQIGAHHISHPTYLSGFPKFIHRDSLLIPCISKRFERNVPSTAIQRHGWNHS